MANRDDTIDTIFDGSGESDGPPVPMLQTDSPNQQTSGAHSAFVMDEVGNITGKNRQGATHYTMTYNIAQRLATMGQGTLVTTFAYDASGNLTLEHLPSTRTTYTYNKDNRLIKQQVGSTRRWTYTYDGD